MSVWSLTCQQSILKQYHSGKHFSELTQIWIEISSLSHYVSWMPYKSLSGRTRSKETDSERHYRVRRTWCLAACRSRSASRSPAPKRLSISSRPAPVRRRRWWSPSMRARARRCARSPGTGLLPASTSSMVAVQRPRSITGLSYNFHSPGGAIHCADLHQQGRWEVLRSPGVCLCVGVTSQYRGTDISVFVCLTVLGVCMCFSSYMWMCILFL